MNIVWAHWKTALSREKYGWVYTIIIVGAVCLLVVDWVEPGRGATESRGLREHVKFYPLLVFLPFWLLASVPMRCQAELRELTEATFSFCLPGHRESLRKVYFSCAVPVGLACCLMWMMTESGLVHRSSSFDPVWQPIALSGVASFLAGMAGFLTLSVPRFVLPPLVWGILALLSIPLFGIFVFGALALCDYPLAGIPVFSGVLVFFWIQLGDMHGVRRGHRAIIDDAMDRRLQAGITRTAPDSMDGLFLDWARRHPALGLERYVWASLYRAFGRVLSYWKWAVAAVLGLSLVLALASREVTELIFVVLGGAAAHVELPVNSNLLLPAGRRERYYATVVVTLVTSLFLIVLALAMAGLSEILALAFGADPGDLGFRLGTAWLAGVFVPWTCVLQLREEGPLGIEDLAPVIFVGVVLLMVFSISSDVVDWPARMRMLLFAGVGLGGWVLFLLRLRRACARIRLPE